MAFFVLFKTAQSEHIIGYDMTLVNIKTSNGLPTNNYKFRLNFYADVLGSLVPSNFTFQIKNSSTHQDVGTVTLNKINPKTLLNYTSKDCAPQGTAFRCELGVYESAAFDGAAYTNPGGYYVFRNQGARSSGLINVFGQNLTSFLLMTMDFPCLANLPIICNSSPQFLNTTLMYFAVGKPYTLNWGAFDADGDSLVYSLTKPLDYGTQKPFPTYDFTPGYGFNTNILDGSPDITIHPKTGIVNFKPMLAGKYLVAVLVEEYRKIGGVPQKIGEVRREMQFEMIIVNEVPPKISNSKNGFVRHVIDTIPHSKDYVLTFTASDSPQDTLEMWLVPNTQPGENILDPTKNAKWGEVGFPLSGLPAQNLIIDGMGIVHGQFLWNPTCALARPEPHTFAVVVRDNRCPSPYYDTVFVSLLVTKKENSPPMFISPDTATKDNPVLKKYFLEAGEIFTLSGDSMLKTYDADSIQTTQIVLSKDPRNGPNFNNNIYFSSQPGLINSSGTVSFHTTCADIRQEPYRITFLAYDNDCYKPDTAKFSVELYVRQKPIPFHSICAISFDSLSAVKTIYWNKISDPVISSYQLYKENTSTGEFDPYGSVLSTADGIFIDGFTWTELERYKIAALDACGNNAVLSPVHSTVGLTLERGPNKEGILKWNPLEGASASSYKIYRGINNSGFQWLATVSDTVSSFVDSTLPIGILKYRIGVERNDVCEEISPNTAQFFVYSNTVLVNTTGMDDEKFSALKVYPNPSSGMLTVQYFSAEQKEETLKVYDVYNRIVFEEKIQSTANIDVSMLPNGLYVFRLGASQLKFLKN